MQNKDNYIYILKFMQKQENEMQISQGMEHCDWLINNRIYKEAIVLPIISKRGKLVTSLCIIKMENSPVSMYSDSA